MRNLWFILSTVFITHFIFVHGFDSVSVNFEIVKLFSQKFRFLQLSNQLLLQVFLDLLLEAEANLAILLIDRFNQFFIFLFLNVIFYGFIDIEFRKIHGHTKPNTIDLSQFFLLILLRFFVGLFSFCILFFPFDVALDSIQLNLLLWDGVRELQHICKVLELYLAIEDEFCLPY